MALKKSFPAPTGQAISSVESRADLAGLVVRSPAGVPRAGILPRGFANLVTARASMGVDVAAFEAVVVRNNLPAFIANDGSVTVPIGAAPVANSRYDIVYAKQNETEAPFSDANNNPVFGFVSGAASATPSLAAALALVPAGGLPLASVLIPSTATTTQSAGVVVTNLYPYTATTGGVVAVRNVTERDAGSWGEGQHVWDIATDFEWVYTGASWILSSAPPLGGSLVRTGVAGQFGVGWTFLGDSTIWAVDQPFAGLTRTNGLLTCVTPGVYDVEGGIQLDSTVNAWLAIKKNNTLGNGDGAVVTQTSVGIAGTTGVSARRKVRLTTGDTVALGLYVSAIAQWSNTNLQGSFFGVTYVEPLR